MKTIVHYGYDLTPRINVEEIDDCVMDNTQSAVVRAGGEAFVSYYAIEWSYNVCHRIDPTRSLAEVVLKRLDKESDEISMWPTCDILHHLLQDLDFDWRQPKKSDLVAFWTMLPVGVAQCLEKSYMKIAAFSARHGGVTRVINNPFFYRDPNASERRLVEIAEVNGFRYAIDRTKAIADPMVLADELTMLNEGLLDNAKVLMTRNNLWRSIREVLIDNGLKGEE